MDDIKLNIQKAIEKLKTISSNENNLVYNKIKEHCCDALNLIEDKNKAGQAKNKLATAIRMFTQSPPTNSKKDFNMDTLIAMDKAYKKL